MKLTDFNLAETIKYNPAEGRVTLGSQRMVIMSARSVGMLLDEIIKTGGENMARIFFRRWGEAAGRDDASLLKAEYQPDTDVDWIALGPYIHSWEGLVCAAPTLLEFDRGVGNFHMKGEWKNSFFAEQWLKVVGKSPRPVCDILSGYATGYASAFFGGDLLAKETTCVACGDDICRFEIRLRSDWE
jgi:predicted hydrocarbon binding protein